MLSNVEEMLEDLGQFCAKLDKFPRVSKKCLKNSEDVAKKIGRLQGHQKNIEKM